MKWPRLRARWVLCLLFCAGTALAQQGLLAGAAGAEGAARAVPTPPAISLGADRPVLSLDGKSLYWIDDTARKTIDEVEAAGAALPWAVREAGQQYRLDGKALWVRFDTAPGGAGSWYLELKASGLDRAQLFHRGPAGAWVVQEAGDTKPVSQWPLPGRVPTFELAETAGSPVRHWLRIEHARVDLAAPMALYSQAALLASREGEQFLLGAYLGLAALIALVAAANALAYRDRSFGAYAVYVLALGAGQVAYLGVGTQYVWEPWLAWNALSTSILPGISAAVALWFVKVVTEPARFSRALEWSVWALIGALLLAVAFDTFVYSRGSIKMVLALTVAALAMVAGLIALVWVRGNDPHIRLIALGFLPVLVMAVFPVARSLNLIPGSALTRYGLSIGAALEMPILFYALSLRGSRRRESQARAAALSYSDALTGLADRRSLLERLGAAMARSTHQRHVCALVVVKLSNYEAIASRWGFEVAERALVVSASVLRNAIADEDLAARVGDREFALLIEGPTTTTSVTARAQEVIVKGLQRSAALPPDVLLRFQIAAALLPEEDLDAAGSVRWVQDAVNAIRPDARRAIRSLNF